MEEVGGGGRNHNVQAGDEIVIMQAGVVVAGGQMNALCWIPTTLWS